MRIHFEADVQSYFSAYKLTLVPGENVIPDDVGKELLEAHAEDCKRSLRRVPDPKRPGHTIEVQDKPRLRLVESKKPAEAAKTAKPPEVVTSATPPKPADPKKGAK